MRGAPAPARRETDRRLLLLSVVALSAAYAWWHLGRGWIAHDDGALGQSAERVLRGELPHRDYIEIYTGGLAYLNAAAFRMLGISLWTMRLVLFAAFVGWVPALWYCASRLVRPMAATALTLLAVVWTIPNYPAPLPSWYNLFLATAGVAAMLRGLDTGRRRWTLVAGIAGGLSCVVKVVGVYYVAGVLLFLVFHAHAVARERTAGAGVLPERGRRYALVVTAALALFVIALLALVRRQAHPAELFQFVLPGAALAALLARNEWVRPAGGSRERIAGLASALWPFAVGVALPIAMFALPYLRAHAVGALLNGVFVLPTLRLGFASMRAIPVTWALTLVPVALLGALTMRAGPRTRRVTAIVMAVAVAAALIATGRHPLSYRVVWLAAFSALPVLVLTGAWTLSRERRGDADDPLRAQRTMLVLSVAAMCSLVQFPFSVPIYFCYVMPLVALVAAALHGYLPGRASPVPEALLAFLFLFAVLRTNTSDVTTFGGSWIPYGPVAPLPAGRGGIVVQADDARMYDRLVPLLREHARGGVTWASPDSPEVYFLTGLRNPTASLFEFFDEPVGAEERLLAALERNGVTAIALNARPSFSPGISAAMFRRLAIRYPHARNVGIFQVRWRD